MYYSYKLVNNSIFSKRYHLYYQEQPFLSLSSNSNEMNLLLQVFEKIHSIGEEVEFDYHNNPNTNHLPIYQEPQPLLQLIDKQIVFTSNKEILLTGPQAKLEKLLVALNTAYTVGRHDNTVNAELYAKNNSQQKNYTNTKNENILSRSIRH